MSLTPSLRWTAALGLGLLLAGTGCTHNHYYTMGTPVGGTTTVCEPTTGPTVIRGASPAPAPVVIQQGALCEVPPPRTVNSSALTANGTCPPGTVAVTRTTPPSSGVVVSSDRGSRSTSWFGWRSRNDAYAPPTQVSGAYDGEVIR